MPDEFQNIKELEQELIASQLLDLRIKANDGRNPIQKIVDFYAVKASLYDDPRRLEKMLNDIKEAYRSYLKTANITGKVLAKKSIMKFLATSENRDKIQRQLRLISKASARQAERRLDLAFTELEKEAMILKADLKIFKKNATIAGFSPKEQLSQLVESGRNKDGIAQGFAQKVKSTTAAAVRREQSAAKIDEYLKVAKDNEQWVWITVSSKPCPDCSERAGKILPYDRWVNMGLPGMGRTICGRACKCDVMPVSIADEKHPTIREFTLNTRDLVLTTASEQRILEAKKNQYNLLKRK